MNPRRVLLQSGMSAFHETLQNALRPVPVEAVAVPVGTDAGIVLPCVVWSRRGGIVRYADGGALNRRQVLIQVFGGDWFEAEDTNQKVLKAIDDMLVEPPDLPEDSFATDPVTNNPHNGVFVVEYNVLLES